jgi:hypothetical protein
MVMIMMEMRKNFCMRTQTRFLGVCGAGRAPQDIEATVEFASLPSSAQASRTQEGDGGAMAPERRP